MDSKNQVRCDLIPAKQRIKRLLEAKTAGLLTVVCLVWKDTFRYGFQRIMEDGIESFISKWKPA